MLPVQLQAQDNVFLEKDSIEASEGFITFPDTLTLHSLSGLPEMKAFKPNPTKAVIYSAIFPGLGQIYNRKYWKLPLVYGAAVGCVYAVSWNGTQYRGYKNAYQDLLDGNPETNSWKAYNYKYYGGTDEPPENWNASALNQFAGRLKNGKDNFRRSLELSYIVSVGVYLLCMIDAYVDAHLFEFDISENLSFKMEPVLFERTTASSRSFGLQCSLTF
ncbi:MAG: DUF5683 domain-containing protein [Dysgonamonadaceae bacterium]|jgi:hypothetical protein|nr:DUF5683 domain-containing protein [Dysgonamonadaceae bacterium]